MSQKYVLEAPQAWMNSPSDEVLRAYVKETEFSQQQLDEEKDYCYFLRKTYKRDSDRDAEYVCMVYSLNQPDTLEQAAIREEVLLEHETFFIHRIAVIREGVLIDKLPDTSIKVMDSEDQSARGVLYQSQKVHLSIKDLHLYDILIIETTNQSILPDEDFLRREYARYIFSTPNTYWAYSYYEFNFINNTHKTILYRKHFFRDENAQVIPSAPLQLAAGESFQFVEKNYLNPVDPNREIYPFIDFATESHWEELTNYIYPIYAETIAQSTLEAFAPDLKEQLDALSDKDKQIQYAIEYVQNSVRYIYNAENMHSHKPQAAALTYANKQGDCKAKCILLKVMLDYLGVESSIILVNYQADFYFKYYFPSLLAFNHVVMKIQHNDKTYFVDPTLVDEYGLLEHRSTLIFCHYLEIKPAQTLAIRQAFRYPKFCLDEKVSVSAQEDTGELKATLVFRYHRANNIRRAFKNRSKREITDSWLNDFFNALNYYNDRKGEDVRQVFQQVKLQIEEDDRELNQVTVSFTAMIEKPYFTGTNQRKFLMYFDRSILKFDVQDFNSKDYTFWHNYDSERHEIHLNTIYQIDTKEYYTARECEINNPYFTYSIKKTITNNGGIAVVEYNPLCNTEITWENIPQLKKDYLIMDDSHYGLGIDIIEPGFFNRVKFLLRRFKS